MNKQVCGAESQAELRVLLKLGAKLSPKLELGFESGRVFLEDLSTDLSFGKAGRQTESPN